MDHLPSLKMTVNALHAQYLEVPKSKCLVILFVKPGFYLPNHNHLPSLPIKKISIGGEKSKMNSQHSSIIKIDIRIFQGHNVKSLTCSI